MRKKKMVWLFGIIIWTILSFNLEMNLFKTANDYFNYFQYDGESLVVGRLILSEWDGLTAHSGFLGWTHPVPIGTDLYWYQYESYRSGYSYDYYQAYYSHPGGQAFLYGLINKITGLYGDDSLEFFRWLVSMFTAFIFTLFIIWVQQRWGWATAVFTLLTILFSQWIILFGRNLFWVVGIFYLPFVASLWYLQKYEAHVKHPLRVTFWLMFICMLLKGLFTGFEYITTTLVMSVTPWIFYALADRWDLRSFLKRFLTASAGAISAVLATMAWLTLQLSFVKGSLSAGFKYILFSFNKRTHGSTEDALFQESLDSSVWEVLSAYWNGHAFNLSHWFQSGFLQSVSKISFGSCTVVFLIISFITLRSKRIRLFPDFRRQQVALTAMLWVSFLAPLSWFVIFKGHSYLHTHMNHIIWHMPFMLLGAVLTGSTLWFFIRPLFSGKELQEQKPDTIEKPPTKEHPKKRTVLLWCAALLVFLILTRMFVFEPVRVAGSSMENALFEGDWIIVDKASYGGHFPQRLADIPVINALTWIKGIREQDETRQWTGLHMPGLREIQRNDIIIYRLPGNYSRIVKRVNGMPGDILELRDGKTWVNNASVEELSTVILPGWETDSIVFHSENGIQVLTEGHPMIIPPDSYFVLGDNRNNSMDSRYHGWVKKEQITGKVSTVLLPNNKNRTDKAHLLQTVR